MIKNISYKFKHIAILSGIAMFFFSCSLNDKENLGEKVTDFPSRTVYNAELQRKEEGILLLELKAPIIEEFGLVDSPYTVFSEGMNLKYYSKTEPDKGPGTLKADWATIREKVGLYHAEGNVEMVNLNGDTIKTNSLYWDTKKKRVYTEDTVYINRANEDRLVARGGVDAKEDMSEFTLFSHKGTFHVDSLNL